MRAPFPLKPRTTSAAARRTVSALNLARGPRPMTAMRPFPSGRWKTVSSLRFPLSSLLAQAALMSPRVASSSFWSVRGNVSSFSGRSKTPLAVISAAAVRPSRRSTWTFMVPRSA